MIQIKKIKVVNSCKRVYFAASYKSLPEIVSRANTFFFIRNIKSIERVFWQTLSRPEIIITIPVDPYPYQCSLLRILTSLAFKRVHFKLWNMILTVTSIFSRSSGSFSASLSICLTVKTGQKGSWFGSYVQFCIYELVMLTSKFLLQIDRG